MRSSRTVLAVLTFGAAAMAQERPSMRDVMDRLDKLEQENREMMAEIRALRQQLAPAQRPESPPVSTTVAPPAAATVEERVAVQERRTEELDQAKVAASQRLPLTLSGTVLFNAFRNGRWNGDSMNPVVASAGATTGGATMRQSIIGFQFRGPDLPWGGKASGSLYLDLYGGTGTSLNQLVRLRVATIDLGWKRTTLSFGQDKPIIAPREPDSLAQVGVSPLTAAGNLWLWLPQFRVEQRFAIGERSGVNAQFGVVQTTETNTTLTDYADTLARSRPGWEGRALWWAASGSRRIEIAPSFHYSTTHVYNTTVPARIYSVDWLIRPIESFDFTGQYFSGENTSVIGGLRQGLRLIEPDDTFEAVHSQGGWGQFTWRAMSRLTFHVYGGQEDRRDSQLSTGALSKNLAYAGNVMYRIGPNVITAFEASQVRSTYLNSTTRIVPHYDLAIAYLF